MGKPFKKDVLVGLSKDVKEKKLERIAEALGEVKETKGEMKLAMSEHRTKIRDLEKEVEALREQVATGKELRSVSVAEVKDYRANVVSIVRVDTKEVVETRAMTTDERQETFPEVPRGGRGKKAPRALAAVPNEPEELGGEA
jgi:uncharacterized coiled-coil DUF342 family protein